MLQMILGSSLSCFFAFVSQVCWLWYHECYLFLLNYLPITSIVCFRAVVDHSVGKDLPSVSIESFEYFPGRGLIATLNSIEVLHYFVTYILAVSHLGFNDETIGIYKSMNMLSKALYVITAHIDLFSFWLVDISHSITCLLAVFFCRCCHILFTSYVLIISMWRNLYFDTNTHTHTVSIFE